MKILLISILLPMQSLAQIYTASGIISCHREVVCSHGEVCRANVTYSVGSSLRTGSIPMVSKGRAFRVDSVDSSGRIYVSVKGQVKELGVVDLSKLKCVSQTTDTQVLLIENWRLRSVEKRLRSGQISRAIQF